MAVQLEVGAHQVRQVVEALFALDGPGRELLVQERAANEVPLDLRNQLGDGEPPARDPPENCANWCSEMGLGSFGNSWFGGAAAGAQRMRQ